MKTHSPSQGVLQLTHSRTGAGLHLAFLVIFFGAWYSFLPSFENSGGSAVVPFRLLFWVAFLSSFPDAIRQIRVLTSGETFTFNRATGVIEHNGVRCASFSEVARIQIRTISGGESSDSYRLSLVLQNDNKLRLAQSANQENVLAVAEDLADHLGVEITRKGA